MTSPIRIERRRRARDRSRSRRVYVTHQGLHSRWTNMGRLLALAPRDAVALLATNAIYGKHASRANSSFVADEQAWTAARATWRGASVAEGSIVHEVDARSAYPRELHTHPPTKRTRP